MGKDIRERLAELGLALPAASAPKGAYVPAVRSGRFVFVAGQIPLTGGELTATGRVGAEVSPESAKELSRQCALAALAAAGSVVPLEELTGAVKVIGYVSSAPGFVGQPAVVDGASELLVDVFGEAGRHARSVVGMAVLPLDAPVEIEIVFEAAGGVTA
ncbi:RidA family protein [Streptomyces griseus]|uniref:RidA family protein n=1 Tax=Streptomyces griseus TaxID=1911 RepID=UPI0004C5F3FE|nr:RidA family protein [Streptomyces griseus]